jgi:DNA-binding FrmR family transcriptional regulator
LLEAKRERVPMAHIVRDKQKLLNRVRRIRGQLHAIEEALGEERECGPILQMIAGCRGAMNGLMAEVIEGHVRFHVLNPDERPTSGRALAAQELIDVVRTYLK